MTSQELNQLGTDIEYVCKLSAVVGAQSLANNVKKQLTQNDSDVIQVSKFQKLLDAELKKLEDKGYEAIKDKRRRNL